MIIKLKVQRSAFESPKTVEFYKAPVTFGRGPTSDVHFDIGGAGNVSTRHAEIRAVDDGYVVVDRDSTNGTWINGDRVSRPRRIIAGDRISLGSDGPEILVLQLDDDKYDETIVEKSGRRKPRHEKTREWVVNLVAENTRKLWIAFGVFALIVVFIGWKYWQKPPGFEREWNEAMAATIRGANNAAIVLIETEIPRSKCAGSCEGTGFAIASNGLIVTNRHVVTQNEMRASRIRVKFAGTGEWLTGTIARLWRDTTIDLALIQLSKPGPYPTIVELSERGADLPVGSAVLTIGFPLGSMLKMSGVGDNAVASTTMTMGATGKMLPDLIQIDAYANHGSSGSPLFDRHGHVIGVIYAAEGKSDRIFYAVPSQFILQLRDGVRAR